MFHDEHGALAPQDALAQFVGAFFDELYRCGVRDVVISPGSRSTPLAMVAYASPLTIHMDIDERGAGFFALGMAKVSQRPVALICTSGTAVGNYYPAVLEAQTSRVPLLVLSGDRPARLQNVGAPQTCDQLKMFSTYVTGFWNMPAPSVDAATIAYVRQVAHDACIAMGACAHGGAAFAGPAHINFPFDEPLTPNLQTPHMFDCGRQEASVLGGARSAGAVAGEDATMGVDAVVGEDATAGENAALSSDIQQPEGACHTVQSNETLGNNLLLPACITTTATLDEAQAILLAEYLWQHKVLVLCGEGTLSSAIDFEEQAYEATCLEAFAHCFDAPLLADPLSNLRSFSYESIIDTADTLFTNAGEARAGYDIPEFDVVIRFGRYPISKPVTQYMQCTPHTHIVVDAHEARDCNSATSMFIQTTPAEFVSAMLDVVSLPEVHQVQPRGWREKWVAINNQAQQRLQRNQTPVTQKPTELAQVNDADSAETPLCALAKDCPTQADTFEGNYVAALIEALPDKSLVFVGNSMSVRAVDMMYTKRDKQLAVLANRGLNGIDGTTSTALGAACAAVGECAHAVLLTGDITFLHDINALALQEEFMKQGVAAAQLVIVLLNNGGGAIFDMLPQQSEDPYFERLFLTPHHTQFEHIARGFGVPYTKAEGVEAFTQAFEQHLAMRGISLIEVPVPLTGVRNRYNAHR